ncbi:hypothetical protein NQZ68_023059 [Dissostichus eleginoides]|nr:hypothetical protein NQZ68_023059 [Dissostichus eleginoides]
MGEPPRKAGIYFGSVPLHPSSSEGEMPSSQLPALWTLEAGEVSGQDRRESSMDPASHTGPRRLSGQALQDQLADGCLRIMTR